jgi:AraC-like DNA-binding protein
MDHKDLVDRYFAAWNEKNESDLLRLLHPQASYYDAYWGEICSGQKELSIYFADNFNLESRWYMQDDELVFTLNGLAIRYTAFNCDDAEARMPIYSGAEIISLSDGLIMTISDMYCDPTTSDLIEVAALAEGQHGRANVVKQGLGAKSSSRIRRRLAKAAKEMTVFRDPSLTVTKLANHVDCSVMQLFHVLEEQEKTTFLEFVHERRARYASTLMVDTTDGDIIFDQIAKQSGFESETQFRNAFKTTFGVTADEYLRKFSK